ncbi:orotate phosphoribosyltransferase [Seleniivibrio woodruffii]|uniref:orotate phosphoribosyltransferase n=1 Tax=Seleniivibrio woodruffii TaxID=1078050 RepID=UPI0024096238|nr:orotate phosphoribosyltransferase [Seleniivibrio woodruffii]
MNADQVLELYKKHNALLEGHFLLSSGLHSDKFLQSELIMQYPDKVDAVIAELVVKLKDVEFDTIVSPAIGGIRFGYELARQMKKRTLFTERVEGQMTLRRGFSLAKGEKVLLAEDVITTGKSTKECINACIDAGADVIGVTCLIDRSGGKAEFDQPFIPLVQLDVKTYDPSVCPMCKEGTPAYKPGSRNLK